MRAGVLSAARLRPPTLVRAEWIALMLALIVLGLRHAAEVRWGRFVVVFVIIDLIGYLPGSLAFRRAHGGPIAAVYHHLYNVTHNFLTIGAVVVAWAAAAGGPEWAMLAMPIHLAGDRGIFGNGFKPKGAPFEHARHERERIS